jgi:nicotinamide-nucleotide amidase
MSEMNERQADLPDNCELLQNSLGTAQGMLWRKNGKLILSMPGVPYEMKHIVSERLLPLLRKEFELPIIVHRTIMTCGMVESRIAELVADVEADLPPHIKLAFLPRPGIVRLRLSALGNQREPLEKEVATYEQRFVQLLGHHVFGYDDVRLEAAIGEALLKRQGKIATAESCTGGTIASMISSVAGASAYFMGSVVSYSNEAKIDLLGVQPDTIANHGAVSEQTVAEMAQAVKQKFGTDYSIAVSGIAGPAGGTPEKPVGTVCFAVSGPTENWLRTYNFGTERQLNIERASMMALYLLWKMMH